MKFFRRVLRYLGYAFALAAILAALAFAPIVQTWIAQAFLAAHLPVQGSVGSVSAGFGKLEIDDLRLELNGAVLTVPSLRARLPLLDAAFKRRIRVESLAAKDWTLDLSRVRGGGPAPTKAVAAPGDAGQAAAAQAEVITAQAVAFTLREIMNGWALPCDVSMDGTDLDGNVLVPGQSRGASRRVHVALKGGGLAAGREGTFAIDAENAVVNSDLSVTVVAAHGRLFIAMASPRTLKRFEIEAEVSAKGGSLPENVAVSADIAASRDPGGGQFTLGLSRGSRRIAAVDARFPDASGRLEGGWKIDLRDSDFAPFFPDHPLPAFSTDGDGRFDADAAFTRVHALGRLNTTVSRLGALAPALVRLGTTVVDLRFDLAHSGQTLRVDQLRVAISATGPNALVQSLQPFVLDENTGSMKVSDPRADWLEGSIRGLPVAWFAAPDFRVALAGGDVAGQFAVRAVNGDLALRSKGPFSAAGVSILRAGGVIGRGLDLSLALTADYASQGWQVEAAPLVLASAGRRLASFDGKAARVAGDDPSIAITGTWHADLDALAAEPAFPGLHWMIGRSASGDFSAGTGNAPEAEAKFTVLGHDPAKSVTGSVHLDFNADGSVGFLAPLKVASGPGTSDLSAEGTWSRDGTGGRIDAKLTSQDATLGHLRLLAVPLAAAAGVPLPRPEAGRPPAGPADRVPFWGTRTGRVTIGFDRLRAWNRVFVDVGGTFDLSPGSLRLLYGRGGLPKHTPANADGSISFDPAAAFPYSLKATAAVNDVEAAPFFGEPQHGQDPLLEGRFSVTGKFTSAGTGLEDLIARTEGGFQLTSMGGIIRLLKTDVADSLPEIKTPVSDTLGSVGSFMGSLVGIKHAFSGGGEIHLPKATEAVLDFTNQVSEIGYEKLTLDLVCGPDRSIRIVDLEMTAPSERLQGSGRIAQANGLSFRARPLSLDLQLSARGRVAELLSNAGLVSASLDKLGYAPLRQSIHFGGTLEHVDDGSWRDFLVKAATPNPDSGKKPAPAANQ